MKKYLIVAAILALGAGLAFGFPSPVDVAPHLDSLLAPTGGAGGLGTLIWGLGNVSTSAGTTLQVSADIPVTFDQAGYQDTGMDWTTVGEVTDYGEFGRVYNLVKHNPVATRGTRKFKGSFDEGSMSMKLGLDTDDAGQIIMKAGASSDSDRSFKLTMQNGDKYYFQAQIMSFKLGVGSVDSITSASCDLELTTSSAGVGVIQVLA